MYTPHNVMEQALQQIAHVILILFNSNPSVIGTSYRYLPSNSAQFKQAPFGDDVNFTR